MLFFIKKILFLISILSLFYSQEETFTKTELYNIYGNKYLSIIEYANTQRIPLKFYKEKNKLEFQIDNFKFLISPHSSFIKVNETIYHMNLPIYAGNPKKDVVNRIKLIRLPIIK